MNYTNTTPRSVSLPLFNLDPATNYNFRVSDGQKKPENSANNLIVYNQTTTKSEDELLTRRWNSIPKVNSELKDPYPLLRGRNGGLARFGIQEVKPEINTVTGERGDHIAVMELSVRSDFAEHFTDAELTEMLSRLISSLPWQLDSGKCVILFNKAIKATIGLTHDAE